MAGNVLGIVANCERFIYATEMLSDLPAFFFFFLSLDSDVMTAAQGRLNKLRVGASSARQPYTHLITTQHNYVFAYALHK